MSPGGLTSRPLGLTAFEAVEWFAPPPQPAATRATVTATAGAARGRRANMAATVEPAVHGRARRRSTPGQSRSVRTQAGAVQGYRPAMDAPRVLLVEDDDAIASGLV